VTLIHNRVPGHDSVLNKNDEEHLVGVPNECYIVTQAPFSCAIAIIILGIANRLETYHLNRSLSQNLLPLISTSGQRGSEPSSVKAIKKRSLKIISNEKDIRLMV
jgi:hypothetical protein